MKKIVALCCLLLAVMTTACSGEFDTEGCARAIEQASAANAGQQQYEALISYSNRAVDHFGSLVEKIKNCKDKEEIEALYQDPKNGEISNQLQQMSMILESAPLDDDNRKKYEELKARSAEVVKEMIEAAVQHAM